MADLAGQTLGKYQLIERMGRGGMADVYKGYQPGLDRYVAVKVMHPHLSEDPDFITRFQREAKSVAGLRHPHIVQVFDFDVQAEHYYMVMEYIEGGQTLKELLQSLAEKGERLPIVHTLDIIAKLADALDYAHNQGMIHRDIKPSNVLIPTIDQPVLSDFGIARLLGQTGLTASGAMIGTPAYMAPEQGRGEQATERSDIYALGIVLYEMLTGRPPYDADTPYGVILKHINDPLTPPHVLVGSLPDAVERIVLKSLAKDPENRYATAGEMRDVLRNAILHLEEDTAVGLVTPPEGIPADRLAFEPAETLAAPEIDDAATEVAAPLDEAMTVAPSEAAAPTIEAPARKRSRWWIWAAAAIAALILIGGGAIVALELLGGEDERSISETAEEGDIDEIGGEAVSDPEELADIGFDLMVEGNTDQAFTLFEQALEIDPDNIVALVGQAFIYIDRGEVDDAAGNLEQAAQVDPEDALVNYGLGVLHRWTEEYYDPDASMEYLTRAIEACDGDLALCAEAYSERAWLQAWDIGEDLDAAIADLGQAIEFQPDEYAKADLYSSRADIHIANGDTESAWGDYEAAYELINEGGYLEWAAAVAVLLEDFDRALNYYDQLLEDQAGDPHYLVGKGYVQWRAGDIEGATQSAARALELDPGLLEGYYLEGLIALEQGNPEAALEAFEPVAQEPDPWSYNYPLFTSDFGHEIHYDIARAYFALGNYDEALSLIEESLSSDDWWPEPYILRGDIFKEQGDLASARESYLMALERAEDPDMINYIENLLSELSG